MFNLNLEQIRQVKVPLPRTDTEAASIVEGLDRIFSDVDALEAEVEHATARVPVLRQSVLRSVLSLDGSESRVRQC